MSNILPVVGEIFNMSNVCDGTGGLVGGRPGGQVTIPIIIPLRGPSCKLRLFRFSVELKFQDGPSVAIALEIVFLSARDTSIGAHVHGWVCGRLAGWIFP